MRRSEWARRMRRVAFVLFPLGLALVFFGSVMAASVELPMQGYLVGSLGLLLIVTGALCWKFAVAGPYPKRLEVDP